MSNYIEFQNVTFGYSDETEESLPEEIVIQNMNISIEKGDFVAVLGHNGCGKSTLAKLCNGIIVPQEGTVLVDGIDTKDDDRLYEIRRKVGMVFQNPDNQIVATIVEDDVAFGPENLGIEPSEIRKRVDEALERVEMYDFRSFEPHKLSGGQKQRVAIAGVIAMQPECIVLDEPTAMLDPRGRREVIKTVTELNRDFGITVILITHFMDEAVKADRVVVMDDGKIILDGKPKEVFTHIDTLKNAGLDVPEATELSDMLIKRGLKIDNDILTIDELLKAVISITEDKN